jgi:hypothetical protein
MKNQPELKLKLKKSTVTKLKAKATFFMESDVGCSYGTQPPCTKDLF